MGNIAVKQQERVHQVAGSIKGDAKGRIRSHGENSETKDTWGNLHEIYLEDQGAK